MLNSLKQQVLQANLALPQHQLVTLSSAVGAGARLARPCGNVFSERWGC